MIREPEQWPQWVKDAVRNANEAGRAAGRAEARNKLTDVNMYLWRAQQALDEAIKLAEQATG